MRVTALIAVAALVIVLGFRFVPPLLPDDPGAAAGTVAITPTTDSDGDGTPDWQELLLSTDPQDASSTPDPNRSLDEVLAEQTAESGTQTPYTDLAARALVSYYQSLKASGSYDATLAPDIGASFADSLTLETAYTTYTRNDLSVSTAATPDAYTVAVRNATAPLLELAEPELAMYARLVQGDESARADLEAAVELFENTAETLVAIPVPNDAVDTHLHAVNSLMYFAAVLQHMTDRARDPLAGFILLQSFNEAGAQVDASFSALSQYLATQPTQSS